MSNVYEDRIDPPQSRIEERLRRIEAQIAGGGGGGGTDSSTATDDDIKGIIDNIWDEDEADDEF